VRWITAPADDRVWCIFCGNKSYIILYKMSVVKILRFTEDFYFTFPDLTLQDFDKNLMRKR
jgi:hypothetical protein